MKVSDWFLIITMLILIGAFVLWGWRSAPLPLTPGTYVLHYDGKRYEPVPFDKAFKDMVEGLKEKTLKEGK